MPQRPKQLKSEEFFSSSPKEGKTIPSARPPRLIPTIRPNTTTQKVESLMHTDLIERIRSGSLVEKELINLYNNAKERNVPDVMAAVEAQMRVQFSRAANRIYGKKPS